MSLAPPSTSPSSNALPFYTSLDEPSSPPPAYTPEERPLTREQRLEVEAEVKRKTPSKYGVIPYWFQWEAWAKLTAWEAAQPWSRIERQVEASMLQREERETEEWAEQ